MTKALDRFMADLAALRLDGAFNPWAEACPLMDLAPEPWLDRQARLRAHFGRQGIKVLLVGEAPGYQGCRFSGMAFTSERLLLAGAIPGVPRPVGRITRRDRPWSEPSATIMWGAFRDLGIQEKVCLWNAFPLHPMGDKPLSNRTPTPAELKVGETFLRQLLDKVLPDVRLIAVGEKAAGTMRSLGLEVPADHCLRHPANGGATRFREGLGRLFVGRENQPRLFD